MAEVTHVHSQPGRIPAKQFLEPTFRGTEKLGMRIFYCWRQVLACKVVKYLHQKCHGLRLGRVLALRRRSVECRRGRQQEPGGVPKEAQEGVHEFRQHQIDFCEESIGADMGTPLRENRVRGLKNRYVRG